MGPVDRTARALILFVLAAACADPVIVTGDAPGVMRVVAGVPDSIGTRVDSLARRTRLYEPGAIAFDDASGVLYVADRGASVTSGGTTRRVARIFAVRSNGRMSLILDSSQCPAAVCPENVHSMDVESDGAIVLSDITGHRLFRLPVTGIPSVLAGNGAPGDAADGQPASGAAIRRPAGVVVTGDGRIYFSEQLGQRVRSIDSNGLLGTVAGNGTPGNGGDGPATAVSLNGPSGLALADGILYVADRLNGRVRAVDLAAGTVSAVAGTLPGGFSGDGGPAANARLDRPESLTVSADHVSLYIADSGNHRIRSVNLATGTIVTLAGTGSIVYNGERRPAGDTSLFSPTGVVANLGFLFIADTGHSTVWRTLAAY